MGNRYVVIERDLKHQVLDIGHPVWPAGVRYAHDRNRNGMYLEIQCVVAAVDGNSGHALEDRTVGVRGAVA